jgi:hypothetical protein
MTYDTYADQREREHAKVQAALTQVDTRAWDQRRIARLERNVEALKDTVKELQDALHAIARQRG